jgi:hypothetical protein
MNVRSTDFLKLAVREFTDDLPKMGAGDIVVSLNAYAHFNVRSPELFLAFDQRATEVLTQELSGEKGFHKLKWRSRFIMVS